MYKKLVRRNLILAKLRLRISELLRDTELETSAAAAASSTVVALGEQLNVAWAHLLLVLLHGFLSIGDVREECVGFTSVTT